MKRILVGIWCVVVCVSGMRAEGWTVEQVPSPKGRGQAFYVSNPDGVLLSETVEQINEVCARMEANTGAELAVVAVNAFDEHKYSSAHGFALKLFNHWGVGSAEANTGILLFLAKDSHDIQIITGDGVAGVLTDGKSGHILDKNIKYLVDEDFDKGMLHICLGIEKELMKDDNRSQLFLGWTPAKPKDHTNTILYFCIGFVLMFLLGIWGYKKLQGKPGMKKEEINDEAYPVRLVTGILMLFFPLPLLLFYIFYRILCKRLQDIPPVCSKCGHDKVLLPKEEAAAHLSKGQLFDEKIDSFQYEVWKCSECGEIEVKPVNGKYYYKFDLCPKCGAHAMETTKREMQSKATIDKNGWQKNTRVCQCCGFTDSKLLMLKKDYTKYSSKSSSSSFFDDDDDRSSRSSSWSRSSGSSSSSGSWGGGRSSGGGAGRKW